MPKAASIGSYTSDPKLLGRRVKPLSISVPSGAGGFNPPSVAGLVGWYDFSKSAVLFTDTTRTTGVTADAQSIKGVTDLSTSVNHLTNNVNAPVYKVNIQSGRSVARFSTSLLSSASFAWGTDVVSVFGTGTFTKSSFGTMANYNISAAGSWAFRQNSTFGRMELVGGATNNPANTTGTDKSGAWHVFSGTYTTGDVATVYVDSTQDFTGSSALTVAANGLVELGARNVDGLSWDGDMGEILLFNTLVSAGDRAVIEAYLKSKWGTP